MALDHTRDPCPWVILNDFGGAFAMGAIGGTVWHGIKGFRNSPYGERRIGTITAVKMRAPVLGGNFGVWGGLFSTFDCAVRGVRRKEDPFNAIAAGFLTGGSLAIRGGFRAARNGAIGCAVLLAVIEGVGIGFQKMLAGSTKLEVRWEIDSPCDSADTDTCPGSGCSRSRESGFGVSCIAAADKLMGLGLLHDCGQARLNKANLPVCIHWAHLCFNHGRRYAIFQPAANATLFAFFCAVFVDCFMYFRRPADLDTHGMADFYGQRMYYVFPSNRIPATFILG